MPDQVTYQDDELFNPETHHEHSDVPIRPLWWAIGIFVVFAALSHVVLWFLYQALIVNERNRAEAPQTAIALPASPGVPRNQPLLQPFPRQAAEGQPLPPNRSTPVVDLIEMRAAEQKILDHYGWVDQQQGVVHIPIKDAKDRAVAILQQKAAPAVAAEATSTAVPGATAPATAAPPTAAAPTPDNSGQHR